MGWGGHNWDLCKEQIGVVGIPFVTGTLFVVLTVTAVMTALFYERRTFCRYLCPLGAALAIPSLIRRVPFIKLNRYDFCSKCKICTRTCSSCAIRADGTIDSRECMECLDCQVNYWDSDVCPVLIKRKREVNSE